MGRRPDVCMSALVLQRARWPAGSRAAATPAGPWLGLAPSGSDYRTSAAELCRSACVKAPSRLGAPSYAAGRRRDATGTAQAGSLRLPNSGPRQPRRPARRAYLLLHAPDFVAAPGWVPQAQAPGRARAELALSARRRPAELGRAAEQLERAQAARGPGARLLQRPACRRSTGWPLSRVTPPPYLSVRPNLHLLHARRASSRAGPALESSMALRIPRRNRARQGGRFRLGIRHLVVS